MFCVGGERKDFQFNLTGTEFNPLIPPCSEAPQLLSSSVSVRDEDDWFVGAGQTLPTARCGEGGFNLLFPRDPVGPSWSGCNKLDRE